MREVVVAGVGMARFGRYNDKTYIDHGVETVQAALADAGLIVGEKRGRWVWWSIVPQRVATLADALAPASRRARV